jgi:hypothetical protein
MFVEAAVLVLLGLHLLAGVLVASTLLLRRLRQAFAGEQGLLLQFFVELLLWPAALTINWRR